MWLNSAISDCNSRLHMVGIQEVVFQQRGDLGQIFDTAVLGHWECCCLVSYPVDVEPKSHALPPFLHWQSLPLVRQVENVRCLLCQAHLQLEVPCKPVLTGVVQWKVCCDERFFLPWLEGEGNWEREAPLHLIKKLGDPTLLFLLLDTDMRGCDSWSCSSHLVTKRCPWQIRDSRLERQEAPKSSIITKPLQQPWYCLPPDFLMERKINPWEYLLPLVATVLFFSTSGHTGAQHFSATKVWLTHLWLETMCDQSIVFCVQWLIPGALPCSGNHGSMYICGGAKDPSSLE